MDSNFGYIFTTDCTDYTDFSSQEATMAGCRTIRKSVVEKTLPKLK